jgi:soluble lytic murein transglycosylase
MTPPSATGRSRRAPSPARSAAQDGGGPRPRPSAATRPPTAAPRRRRRLAGAALAVGAVLALVLLTVPIAKRAVNEFGLPLRYAATIRAQARAKHLDPALIAGVIYAETKFDPRTSAAGAEGPMQVEPQTALYLAHRSGATSFTTADLKTPSVNIAYGSYYLRELLNQFHGSELLALAAYNGGAGNVAGWEREAEAHGHALRISDIRFPETRAYVAKVLGAQQAYRHRYAHQLGYR